MISFCTHLPSAAAPVLVCNEQATPESKTYFLENLLLLPQNAEFHSHAKESIVGYSLVSSTSNTSAAQKASHH